MDEFMDPVLGRPACAQGREADGWAAWGSVDIAPQSAAAFARAIEAAAIRANNLEMPE